MNDNLAVSSQNAVAPYIQHDQQSQDPSLGLNTEVSTSENLTTEATIPALLKEDDNSSHVQLTQPTCQLTPKLIASLSSLAHQGILSNSQNDNIEVNDTPASGVLAIIELYLENQKKIAQNYTNPGAPHEAVTARYQQEMEASHDCDAFSLVALRALSIEKIRSLHSSRLNSQKLPLEHQKNDLSRPNLLQSAIELLCSIPNFVQISKLEIESMSTANLNKQAHLTNLAKASNEGKRRENINTKHLSHQSFADIVANLSKSSASVEKKGFKTLVGVTATLRPQPIKNI